MSVEQHLPRQDESVAEDIGLGTLRLQPRVVARSAVGDSWVATYQCGWDAGEVGDDVRRGCRSANELYTTVGSARGVTRRAYGVLMPMRAVS